MLHLLVGRSISKKKKTKKSNSILISQVWEQDLKPRRERVPRELSCERRSGREREGDEGGEA